MCHYFLNTPAFASKYTDRVVQKTTSSPMLFIISHRILNTQAPLDADRRITQVHLDHGDPLLRSLLYDDRRNLLTHAIQPKYCDAFVG